MLCLLWALSQPHHPSLRTHFPLSAPDLCKAVFPHQLLVDRAIPLITELMRWNFEWHHVHSCIVTHFAFRISHSSKRGSGWVSSRSIFLMVLPGSWCWAASPSLGPTPEFLDGVGTLKQNLSIPSACREVWALRPCASQGVVIWNGRREWECVCHAWTQQTRWPAGSTHWEVRLLCLDLLAFTERRSQQ